MREIGVETHGQVNVLPESWVVGGASVPDVQPPALAGVVLRIGVGAVRRRVVCVSSSPAVHPQELICFNAPRTFSDSAAESVATVFLTSFSRDASSCSSSSALMDLGRESMPRRLMSVTSRRLARRSLGDEGGLRDAVTWITSSIPRGPGGGGLTARCEGETRREEGEEVLQLWGGGARGGAGRTGTRAGGAREVTRLPVCWVTVDWASHIFARVSSVKSQPRGRGAWQLAG